MTGRTAAAKTVERYRKHLDSPYGQELHDLAEIPILAIELRELVALAEQADALADEFGILDDGKAMEIDGKSQVLLLNDGQARAALEVRAKGIFAADAHRPARLMQRPVTGWQEIPGDGARGTDGSDAHSCDNCSGIDPDTCLFNGEKEDV
jgi:hypothetical protein